MASRNASKRPEEPKVEQSVKNPILVRERRAALVDAAIDVFYNKGFHACRVKDVAEAAGLSQGTVYNYVRSKEDLLFLVCEDHLNRYRDDVTRAVSAASSPRDKLNALLEATLDGTFRYRKHYAVMMREIHHVEKEKRRGFMDLAAAQRQVCENVLEEAGLLESVPPADATVIANLILFLPSFIAARGWDLRDKSPEAQVKKVLLDFVNRGLGVEGA